MYIPVCMTAVLCVYNNVYIISQGNKTISDKHIYYTSTYYPAGDPVVSSLWQDLAGMVDDVVVDNLIIVSDLSGLHRYYQVIIVHAYMYGTCP